MYKEISNQYLKARVNLLGAELCSLTSNEDNQEYIWQGDPKYWEKHSPILFPFIGSLKDDQYTYNEKVYTMPKHGFVKDMLFEVLTQSESQIVLGVKSYKETLEIYPFIFELRVTFELKGQSLNVTYSVSNKDNKEMYFSIGGHPALNCDIASGKSVIEFEMEENFHTILVNLQNGLIKRQRENLGENMNEIILLEDLFKRDTLIFQDLNSSKVTIKDQASGSEIRMSIDEFPYLGIWTPPGPFVCIEPWHGIPDYEDVTGQLEEKPGIISLNPDSTHNCSYDIEVMV